MTKANTAPKRGTNETDRQIGARIRAARLKAQWSQTELGHLLNVTFQQIQKYENGGNRVSGHRIQQVAEALKVSVEWLVTGEAGKKQRLGVDVVLQMVGMAHGLELANVFVKVPTSKRKLLLDMAKGLAA